MAASVLVGKYAWHLPLYRRSQMLAAQGLEIKRSVLAFWVGYAAAELEPLYLAPARTDPRLRQDRGRRDEGAGARSRPRSGQAGLLLGDRPRRSTLGRDRSAGHRFHLRAGPRGSACAQAARRLLRRGAMRRLLSLHETRRRGAGRGRHARVLLVASAATVLRPRQERQGADRQRSARTHRRALCDREDDPRRERRGAAQRAPGKEQAAGRGAQDLARATACPRVRQGADRRGPSLRPEPLGRSHITRFLDDGRIELDTNIVERGISQSF